MIERERTSGESEREKDAKRRRKGETRKSDRETETVIQCTLKSLRLNR